MQMYVEQTQPRCSSRVLASVLGANMINKKTKLSTAKTARSKLEHEILVKTLSLLWMLVIVAMWIALSPHSARASDNLSPWALCNSRDPVEAVIGCTALLESNALDAKERSLAYQLRSDAYVPLGAIDIAIEDRSLALELDPSNPEIRTWLARALFLRGTHKLEIGDLTDAIRHLEFSYALDSTMGESRTALALAYEQIGSEHYRSQNLQEALASLSRAIELSDGRRASIQIRRAQIYFDLKMYNNAISDLDSASEASETNFSDAEGRNTLSNKEKVLARIVRAKTLIALERFELALHETNYIISSYGTSVDAFLLRGLVRTRLEYFSGAISDYKMVLSIDKDNKDAEDGLAFVQNKQLAITRAVQAGLKRLGCNPGPVDGKWGKRSASALNEFYANAMLKSEPARPNSELVTVLSNFSTFSPEVCQPPAYVGVWDCPEFGPDSETVFSEDTLFTLSGERIKFHHEGTGDWYILIYSWYGTNYTLKMSRLGNDQDSWRIVASHDYGTFVYDCRITPLSDYGRSFEE